jgi:hypothetical protein
MDARPRGVSVWGAIVGLLLVAGLSLVTSALLRVRSRKGPRVALRVRTGDGLLLDSPGQEPTARDVIVKGITTGGSINITVGPEKPGGKQ